jgi:hypothetical protein
MSVKQRHPEGIIGRLDVNDVPIGKGKRLLAK